MNRMGPNRLPFNYGEVLGRQGKNGPNNLQEDIVLIVEKKQVPGKTMKQLEIQILIMQRTAKYNQSVDHYCVNGHSN